MRPRRGSVGCVALGLLLVALFAVPAGAAAAVTVGPGGSSTFSPQTVTINAGDTVEWTAGSTDHTVTADDGSFDSAGGTGAYGSPHTMAQGEKFSHAFSTPGTFRYFCQIHGGPNGSGMSGIVQVNGAPAPPARVVSSFSFAEGTVRQGFQEFLTIQNAGASGGTAQLTFQASDDAGRPVAVPSTTLALPASSRVTENVNDYLAANNVPTPVNLSVLVTADIPVVAERPVYFHTNLAGGVDGGTDVIGAPGPSTSFSFAEGTVRQGFQEFLTIQNPMTQSANATVSFQAANDTGMSLTVPPMTFAVGAGTRTTKDVNAWLAQNNVPTPANVSARVTSDGPVVAERPLYFSTALAGGADGGTSVVGFVAPGASRPPPPPPVGGGPGPETTVQMANFLFNPMEITVPMGSRVTWVYSDTQCDVIVLCPGHNSTSAENGPDGKPLWASETFKGQGKSFTIMMTVPGTHPYFCSVHGGPHPNNPLTRMNGVVKVTP